MGSRTVAEGRWACLPPASSNCLKECSQDEPFSTPPSLPAVSQSPWEAPAVCGALPRAALGLGGFHSGPRSHLPGFSLGSHPVVTQASRPGLQGPSVTGIASRGKQSDDDILLTSQSLDPLLGFKVTCLISSFSLMNTAEERVSALSSRLRFSCHLLLSLPHKQHMFYSPSFSV